MHSRRAIDLLIFVGCQGCRSSHQPPKLSNLFTIKMITFNSRQRKEGTYLVQGIFPTSNAYLPFDVSVIKGLLGSHNDLQNGQEPIYWALTVAAIN